ncbi:MAG: beta strand repeat-containing protein [Candidatus Kerfeldbacteria bacterium]
MKKLAFVLGISIAIFVSANFAEAIQIIDDALQVNSLRVGQQGVGGVTYFNGTIINETTTDGVGNPVAFGDDVRIDGRLFRGATAGTGDTQPFIINDNLEVVGSLTVGSTNILSSLSSLGTTDANLQSQITTLETTDSSLQSQISAKGVGDMLKSTYDIAGNSKIDAGKLDSGIAATLISSGGVNNTIFNYLASLNLDNTGNIHLTALGIDAGALVTGADNTLFGYQAGDAITSGINNTAFGYNTLSAISTNANNTAIGSNALAVSTATNNTAIGYDALAANTIGNSNTAVGSKALDANTEGEFNTAIGYSALTANILASSNTAIGYNAMAAHNGAGAMNVAIGRNALDASTGGTWNVAVGYETLTTGTGNDSSVAVGYQALRVALGDNNVAVGYQAGNGITSGNNNILIGYDIDAASPGASSYYLNIGDILTGSLDPTAPGLSIDSGFALTPSTDQTREATSTITIDNGIVRVVSDGGGIVLGSTAIEDGAADGQIVIIQGTHDTNTVQIPNAANTALVGDAAITLGKGDNIQLMWDSGDSLWYEISRADH